MKSFVKFCKIMAGVLVVALFAGCEVGMGTALDLEAPEITVISPETLSNVRKSVSIKGTCKDNIGVTSIEVQDKQTGKIYGNASITGNDWVADITLEEGEKTILCIAKDAAGNSSIKSIKTLFYLVDETAPEGKLWNVDRGDNKLTDLKSKEELESIDYDDFTNIDVPQNEQFIICGRFYDAMSIKEITIELYEDETKVAEKTISAEGLSSDKSIYSPRFEFKASDLPANLQTGKHYLQLFYSSEDEHGNKTQDKVPVGYMLWWPESDNPRISLTEVVNNVMRVNIGSAIPIHFFDDDLLSEVRYTLVSGSVNESAILSNPDSISWTEKKTNINAESKRDLPVQIFAPNSPCQIKLVAYAKDTSGNKSVKVCVVDVADASKPLLFVETPEDNSVPQIKPGTSSSFEVAGYALDTSGCQTIKIAYVPELKGQAAEDKGKALLKGTATPENGQFVKTGTLGAMTDSNGGWKKQDFKFTFDLLQDFKNGSTSYAKEDKFFELLLIDKDNNEVFRQLVVSGDKKTPDITVVSPTTDMSVYDYINGSANFEIKFKASKESGLGVDNDRYYVKVVWTETNSVEYTKANSRLIVDSDGYAVVNIPKSEIASKKDLNVQPKIIFEAYDILGNKAEARRNVVLSPLPQLKTISSGNMNGTFKKGDVIKFQAVFSDAVKVAGIPKLVLQYSEDDINPKYADYTGTGNRTDTLVFEYTVPENAECDKLIVDYKNPIKVQSGDAITEISIKTAATGEGNAYLTTLTKANTLAGKEFKLDGKLPEIKSITVAPEDSTITANADGNYYLKATEVIKATVQFTEKVNINGSPVLKLYGGASGTTAIDFNLQSIENDTIVFTHKIVKGTTPEGTLKYDFANAFAKAASGTNKGYVTEITDEAGNPLKLVKTDKGDKNLIIDTTAPAAAPVINIAGGTDKKYNRAQTLTLTGESGATIEYSHNGGISWYVYSDKVSLTSTGFTAQLVSGTTEAVTVSGGEYNLKTRQIDKAGNMSPESAVTHFTINNTFPAVTSLVISKPNGKYAAGEKVKFVLTYGANIKVPDATSIVLGFKLGTSTNRTVNAKPVTSASGSSKVEFEYTVTNQDEGDGIAVTSLTYSTDTGKKTVDLYGNSPASNVTISSYTGVYITANRPEISLDGKPPVISTYSPAKNTVAANGKVITLTFSENVEKEAGMITLRRKSTATEPWRIPPVMTEDEFNSVFNEVNETDKTTLMRRDGDAPALFEKNGQPLGPYKRITHGLVGGDGSSTAPDINTKFVLDFNIGIKDGSGYLADGTEVQVSDLRAVFERAKYHMQEVEVTETAVTVNGKVVTITFPKALADGREWELYIEPGAFRDETGNLFEGLGYTVSGGTTTMDANSTYSFWSDKVAKPWVRVDRYSHGYAAIEPVVTGSGTTATYSTVNIIASKGTNSSSSTKNATNTQPSGYARVRIDCETPGATIAYGWDGNVTGTCTPSSTTSNVWTATTTVTDKSLAAITAATTYNGYFVVGDGGLYTARRDFVKAKATKTGFTDSAFGYEGVFKTVVTYNCGANQNYTKVEGGTKAGGMPSYGGFPLRDAEEGKGHDKGCYRISAKQYVWQSYDIVSDWQLLPYNGNYTSRYYWCGYGYNNHINSPAFYSNPATASNDAADYSVTADMMK